jgi:hypothetical protein
MAPAGAGFRDGERVTACIEDRVYEYDTRSEQCRRWDALMTGPAGPAQAECSVVESGGSSTFVVRPFGGGESMRLDFQGDALLSPPLLAHVVEARPSFEEARREADAVAERAAPSD